VTEQTAAEICANTADAARQARVVLAALGDPDSELTATPAIRNRLKGRQAQFVLKYSAPTAASAVSMRGTCVQSHLVRAAGFLPSRGMGNRRMGGQTIVAAPV
jgi:hypothetical protein